MLKRIAFLFFSCLTVTTSANALQSNEITYEWLTDPTNNSGYSSYLPHLRLLFNTMKVKGFLQCGCSYSTKYFSDNSEELITIEFISSGYSIQSYQNFLSLFSNLPNWFPTPYNKEGRSNSFNNACSYQCAMHKDYALIDPSYLNELNDHFVSQIDLSRIRGSEIEVAFVNPPGNYLRGDFVKLFLANEIPIVIAHDTASDNGVKEKLNLYGWNKVVTPAGYVKIYIPYAHGTTFWISKQLPNVIAAVYQYKDGIQQLREEGIEVTDASLTELADNI